MYEVHTTNGGQDTLILRTASLDEARALAHFETAATDRPAYITLTA